MRRVLMLEKIVVLSHSVHRPIGTGPLRIRDGCCCLQRKAEESQETTSDDGGAVLGEVGSSTSASSGGGGTTGRGAGSARSLGARGGSGSSGNSAALINLELTAGGVLGLLALELLGEVLVGGVDALAVPEVAHLGGDGLLIGGNGGLRVGAVTALAGEVKSALVGC